MKLGAVCVFVGLLLLGVVWSFGMSSETAVGGLMGTVVMTPSAKPLPNAEVIAYPQSEEPEGSRHSWVTETDSSGNFKFRGLPVGVYQIQVYGKSFQSKDNLAVIVKEGKSEQIKIVTVRPYDSLELVVSQKVYLPTEKIAFTVSGYTDSSEAKIAVYRVPYEQVFEKGSPETVVQSLVGDRNAKVPTQFAGLQRVLDENRNLAGRDIEGHFVEQVNLDRQDEGLFVVQVIIGKETRFAWITVSKIALVTKAQGNQTLAFVTDLESGQPIGGAAVSYMAASGLVSVGQTQGNGTCSFTRANESKETKVVVVQSGNSRAFTWFYSGRDGNSGKTIMWAQTDRPVYRPGDTVQYKIVARDSVGSSYLIPTGNVSVEITDADQDIVEKKELPLSADGTTSGSFKIDSQALPESYSIKISRGQSTEFHDVDIVSYRKPEFRVTVTPEKKQVVRGSRARFLVHVETYTGEPGSNMDVSVATYGRQDWKYSPFDDEADSEYESSSDYLGEFLEEKKSRTDDNGDCWIESATNGSSATEDIYSDSVFSVTADVSDESGRTVSAKGSVSVVRGEFDLSSAATKFIYSPTETVSVNFEAKPNSDQTYAAPQKLEVTYGHYRWNKQESIFVSEGTTTLEFDASGKAIFEAKPKGVGEFVVRAITQDSKGNQIGSEQTVWIDTVGADYGGPIPEISLTLDKPNYQPTDSAKVLIRTEFPGGSALLTVEADGVLWSQVVPLTEKITTCVLSGLQDYAPNVSVNVSYIRSKKYLSAQRNLKVDLVEKQFKVELTPDKATTLPGDIVSFNVKATSNEGQPVRANFALSVVDESVYAIAEDRNDPIKNFYPRRWSTVQTAFSFPDVYLDGEDKNPLASKTRKNFQDTAYWNPEVTTNEQGMASVSVKLPDNLTDWRATVKGFTKDTKIAQTTAHVVAKKDLMARLTVPTSFIEGDTQTVFARITNSSTRSYSLSANLAAVGAEIKGEKVQQLTLQAGESRTVSWEASTSQYGSATFQLTAKESAGSAVDSQELKVPIVVYGQKEQSSFVGQTTTQATGSLDVASSAVDGKLDVQVSPTLLGSLIQALPTLVDYPYGCTEQTMSRFVPALMVVRKLRSSGLVDPSMEAKLPAIVKDSLTRLKRLQNSLGGWGWWEYDSPDEWMTAYVLEGLWRVRGAGVNTSTIDTARAIAWGKERIKVTPPFNRPDSIQKVSDRLELACSMLLFDQSPEVLNSVDACLKFDKLRASSLARAIVVLKATNLRQNLLQPAYRRLMSMADETADTLHWADLGWYQETGAALEAIAVMEPKSPWLEKAFRYLNSVKKGDGWTSTRDTARIVVSVATYLQNSKELSPDCDITITINGAVAATKHFSRSDLTMSPYALTIPIAQLKKGANSIQFKVAGQGKIYYSAFLSQLVRKSTMPATSTIKGASFERNFFAVATTRSADGTLKRVLAANPTQAAQSGQVLRCKVAIQSEKTLDNVMIEVPIPSNMRIVDEEMPLDGATWLNWWARTLFLDDRAVFFGTVPAGRPVFLEFAVRAESPGQSAVLPASLVKMYQPTEKVSTTTQKFVVQRK